MFEMIKDNSLLSGTCYIEIVPGKFKHTNWNVEAVFLKEETFLFIESIIYRKVPEYGEWGHWGITEIEKEKWKEILFDLEDLINRIETCDSIREIVNDEHIQLGDMEKHFKKILKKMRKN